MITASGMYSSADFNGEVFYILLKVSPYTFAVAFIANNWLRDYNF
jgi:hypothetical protein